MKIYSSFMHDSGYSMHDARPPQARFIRREFGPHTFLPHKAGLREDTRLGTLPLPILLRRTTQNKTQGSPLRFEGLRPAPKSGTPLRYARLRGLGRSKKLKIKE